MTHITIVVAMVTKVTNIYMVAAVANIAINFLLTMIILVTKDTNDLMVTFATVFNCVTGVCLLL
jgi:hypothetical protein